jgi:hypothetical protein
VARAENKGGPAAKPGFKPQVFSLMRQRGNFESSPVAGRPGWRTVGFWSGALRTPRVGDLIVKPGVQHPGPTVWELEQVKLNFTGSDSNQFWHGLMRDLVYTNTITHAHVEALEEAGRSDPDVRPR